jgi:hypothetical protein
LRQLHVSIVFLKISVGECPKSRLKIRVSNPDMFDEF